MIKSQQFMETGVHISPRWIMGVLVLSGLALAMISDSWTDPASRLWLRSLVILFYTVSLTGWLLDSWKAQAGRWFIILALIAIIFLGFRGLEGSELLALLVIPTALAATMVSLPAAAAVAIGETLLLMLLPNFVTTLDRTAVIISLLGIWGILGIMFLLYQSTVEVIRPLLTQFWQAQQALEEARDRKAELEQTLDDLAQANRELALLNERVSAMRLVAEEAQKTKVAFVAKVSHEFRTPLNMIIGLTDLVVAKPEVYGRQLPSPLLEDLKIVHRNCEHLSKMVNDVLDLSQKDIGALTLRREWVDLTECVESTMEVIHPLVAKKTLDLQIIIPEVLPRIYCDQIRIRQVILNLLSNAVRFTDRGGITFQIESESRFVIIKVTDTGPGILPEDAEIIFEPFCQGTSTLWRDQGGSGLGLSISKQFVELHHGELWLESEPGVGTTFFVKLPVSPPAAPAARPGRWIGEHWLWHERSSRPQVPQLPYKQRMVICDDTGDFCAALMHYSDEIEFVYTRNLAQAIQELQEKTAHALVINSDSLGNLWSLIEQARTKIPDTPIIACSFRPQVNRALEAGAIDYLIKPVTQADLHQAIQNVGRPVKKILIVDDDPNILQLFTRMLATENDSLEIAVASNGRQALNKLSQLLPDLVLLDIVMLDQDGWQTLELKNLDEMIRDIPVIVISAQDPANQPMTSKVLVTTFGQGLPVSQFLRCSLELSALMLQPE